MPEATIAARFIGGAYDGQTEIVPAAEDKLIGAYPALHTIRRAVPPEFSLASPVPDEAWKPPLPLYYRREHRGGAWLYVLYGVDEAQLPETTDPLLEAFVAHVRREWPARQTLTGREVCHIEYRSDEEFDRYMESKMLARMHQEASDKGRMVVLVDGPRWEPQDDNFTTTCTVRATIVPQFGGKQPEDKAQTLLDEQRYVPPVDGMVPPAVATWGTQSQLRWFAQYRSQLGWRPPAFWEQFYIDSELHRGWCCSSCLADVEAGYDERDPDRCCCAAGQRASS